VKLNTDKCFEDVSDSHIINNTHVSYWSNKSALIDVVYEGKKYNIWAIGWNIQLPSIVYSISIRTLNKNNLIRIESLHDFRHLV
jgi:hypothetical protein